MKSTATDLAQYLADKGYGTIGDDLSVSFLPDQPDKCVAVIDSGSWREFEGQTDLENPTIQILLRGDQNGFLALYALAEDIRSELIALGKVTESINGTFYGGVWQMSGPIFVGYDESKRPMYSINFRVMRSG